MCGSPRRSSEQIIEISYDLQSGTYIDGYNAESVATVHQEMVDDVKVVMAEYRLALKKNKRDLKTQFGVTKIGLFGSYARGEARNDSDIDIIVEIEGDRIFRKFFALESYLKDQLKKEIDLGTESAIKPIARQQIAKEIIYV